MSTIQATNIKHASSSNTNLVMTSGGNVTVGGTMAMSSSFMRNRIINGAMGIWQRGTSFSVTSGTTAYTADRFYAISVGGTTSVSQVSGTGGFQNALRLTGGSGVTNAYLGQKIESVNAFDLAGGSVTVQIRAAASTSRTLSWVARYPNTTDNYAAVTLITSGSVSLTTTQTVFTFTFSVPAAATTGLELYFDTGSFTSGTIDITGVQLEVGSVATPFEREIYSTTLAKCQRYYARMTAGTGAYTAFGSGRMNTTTGVDMFFKYPTTMRAAPTFNYSAVIPSGTTLTGVGATYAGLDSILVAYTVTGATLGQATVALANGTTAAYVDFSAEL